MSDRILFTYSIYAWVFFHSPFRSWTIIVKGLLSFLSSSPFKSKTKKTKRQKKRNLLANPTWHYFGSQKLIKGKKEKDFAVCFGSIIYLPIWQQKRLLTNTWYFLAYQTDYIQLNTEREIKKKKEEEEIYKNPLLIYLHLFLGAKTPKGDHTKENKCKFKLFLFKKCPTKKRILLRGPQVIGS